MNDKLIQIYKGKHYYKSNLKHCPKVIAFDLDETLGSFVDLDILWNIILQYRCNDSEIFNELLDLYPEFLRFGIFPILEYLFNKKKKAECQGLYIYTNNQCSPPWTTKIAEYFNKKINNKDGLPLFDKVICAFKINNKIVEVSRTSHEKSHNDFIRCTLLPKNTEICFIDNTYYSSMNNRRIYYIKPRAYVHSLSTEEIINRFIHSNIGSQIFHDVKILHGFILGEFYKRGAIHDGNASAIKIETDVIVAQKMMYHIKEFFYITQKNTKTRKYSIGTNKITRKLGGKPMVSSLPPSFGSNL